MRLKLDTAKKEVRVDDALVELTAYEYKVLEYLMLNPSRVVSKTELTDHLYEQDFDRDSNVIEVFVGRLRKKLNPINPDSDDPGAGLPFFAGSDCLKAGIQTRLLLITTVVLGSFLSLAGVVLDRSFRVSVVDGAEEQLKLVIYSLMGSLEKDGPVLRFGVELPEPRLHQPESGLYATVSGRADEPAGSLRPP